MKTNLTQSQLNQLAELITFNEDEHGVLTIQDVKVSVLGNVWGNVWGSVKGSVYGSVKGNVWDRVNGGKT
tara:strand:+ start:209 stop:418 length:210 start_codon:yes stop_codon:yes gene_type:complete